MPRKKVTCEEINKELLDFPPVYRLEICFAMVFDTGRFHRKFTLCGSHHRQMLINLKSRLDLMHKEELKLFLQKNNAVHETEAGRFLLSNVNITVTNIAEM